METAPQVIGYTRVSTEDQEDGAGLDAQAFAIRTAATQRGWDVEIVQEVVSGRKGLHQRPVLSGVLARLRKGDVLVVAKGDRLARSLMTLSRLLEDSDSRGWSLIALDLGVDTSTPAGRLAIQVIGAAAEYESRMIGARTREAMAVHKANGATFGCPRRVDGDTRQRIRAVRAQGWTLQRIANALNRDNIPTPQGGATWRPSSVRAAVLASV